MQILESELLNIPLSQSLEYYYKYSSDRDITNLDTIFHNYNPERLVSGINTTTWLICVGFHRLNNVNANQNS